MFFDDADLGGLKKQAALRVPPPVPDTGWLPPTYYPDLSRAVVIALDTETKELDFDNGPGWSRNKGHIVGVSLAALDAEGNRGKWYFPVRHECEPEYNLDPETTFRYLKSVLETPHIPKVGANLLYDIGWLTEENIFVTGELYDVQFAEALLREDSFVGLEHLGAKYCGEGKTSDTLYQWLADAYGGEANDRQRANIYRAPARLAGPYAEQDADLPLRVIQAQWPQLEKEGLVDLYRMECDGIYLLTQMRMTGVRVDLQAAEKLYHELANDIDQLKGKLYHETGVYANVDSGGDLAKIFDVAGIKYPHTEKGAPSFTKDYLKTVEHPIADLVREIREIQKIRGTFIRSYILESNVDGRVHCQFHPLRGDGGGTRSGRFSSDCPNLQNIPVRTELGKKIRALFLPDYYHLCWEKDDYSQIEYRFLVHFAVGPGSDAARARYNSDPKTDYHEMTQQLVFEIARMMIERKPIKNINFGLLYGMGEAKLARQIGIIMAKAKEIFKAYHEGNPYVKATMDAAAAEAQKFGYVTTILNRRSRFDMWEPRNINYENRAVPLRYNAAIAQYGADIIRASTHKAINRRLQGSAADMIKKGMHQCWKEGVFNVIGVPKLQVHDELDFSVRDDTKEQREGFAYMRYVLENAIKLRVPVLVDSGRGPNWGAIA